MHAGKAIVASLAFVLALGVTGLPPGDIATYGPVLMRHAIAAPMSRAEARRQAADLPALRTGDRELGPLWTAGLGAGARFGLGSSEDPFSFSILTSVDAYYTRFTDALYVTDRVSGLGTVVGEVKF